MRVAPELLGAPTIGGGSARPGGGGGGSQKKSDEPSKPPRMYKNGAKMASFLHLLTLKKCRKHRFLIKST
jgi:hypothetical protein